MDIQKVILGIVVAKAVYLIIVAFALIYAYKTGWFEKKIKSALKAELHSFEKSVESSPKKVVSKLLKNL
jgi:hypothetical protein